MVKTSLKDSIVILLQSGDTPLHFACQNGHFQIVEALIEQLFRDKTYLLARLIVNIPNNVSLWYTLRTRCYRITLRNSLQPVEASFLHHYFSIHNLHTDLSTFPVVLTRRICLRIRSFVNW